MSNTSYFPIAINLTATGVINTVNFPFEPRQYQTVTGGVFEGIPDPGNPANGPVTSSGNFDFRAATANRAPVADAGPDHTAKVTQIATLDGSRSTDADGDSLHFAWSLVSKPASSIATLSDPTAVRPTYVVDKPGTYVFQLTVNDGTLDSAPDSVTIATTNSSPVANAGPDQTARVTDTVHLDGSGSSDVDGDTLHFRWSISVPAGSAAALTNSTAVNPTFVVDRKGAYVAQLIVNDGAVDMTACPMQSASQR